MSTPAPVSVVKAFATDAVAPYITNPLPVPSQIGIVNGKASYDTGFVPLNMTDRSAGGVPPSGADMNGILYAISSHTAWLAAGGQYHWSAAVVAAYTGYGVGVILQSAVTPTLFFLNTLANNVNDPDGVTTGWISYSPAGSSTKVQSVAPTAGPNNDLAINAGIGFLEITPAGDITLTGMSAGFDGQIVTLSNLHASRLVEIMSLNGGSVPANQFRMAANITLTQYGSVSFRYSVALALWIQL